MMDMEATKFGKRLVNAFEASSDAPWEKTPRVLWLQAKLRGDFATEIPAHDIEAWCLGRGKPADNVASSVAQILQVPVSWLITGQ